MYRLEDGLVAKVWANKQGVNLKTLKAFFEELGEQSLTPRIHGVRRGRGDSRCRNASPRPTRLHPPTRSVRS